MADDAVDKGRYRRVVGRFATGVTVLSTVADGTHLAMTVNSFTSVSLDPVLVLVSVERRSRIHDVLLAAGHFGVSVLDSGQERLARRLAVRGRPSDARRYAGYASHVGPRTGSLLFDDALATLECRTTASLPAGDHTVLLGEVLALATPRPSGHPLLYYEGKYRRLPGVD